MTRFVAARPCGLVLGMLFVSLAGTAVAEPIVSAERRTADADGDSIGVLSVAGGVASMDATGTSALIGGGIALAAGLRISPRVALAFDLGMILQSDGPNESGRHGGTQTVGLQVWPWSRLWLRGAAGVGWVEHSGGSDDDYHRDGLGPTVLVAAGVEIIQRPGWSVDAQLRSAAMWHYAETAVIANGLFVGVSWH